MPDPSVREYWDKYLEHNPLRTGWHDTDAAAFLSWMIEAGGDILRELAHEKPDQSYIFEKFNRLKNNLDERDWRDPLSVSELGRLQETRQLLQDLPTPDARTQTIKSLLQAITERNTYNVKRWLDILRPMIASKPIENFKEFAENWRK